MAGPSADPNMRIDEAITAAGPSPDTPQVSHTGEPAFQEVTKVYHEIYAPGLSDFFETSWYYFVDRGKITFPADSSLVGQMSAFLKTLRSVAANDHAQMARSGSAEARIVWELARISYQAPDAARRGPLAALPPDGDAKEARNRVKVVEALLTGQFLTDRTVTPPMQDPDAQRVRQFEFWHGLAEFLRWRPEPHGLAAVQAREAALRRMRPLLDARENRDVLYSIAVMRQMLPLYRAGQRGDDAPHAGETDPDNRLAVASNFILQEAQATGGTTNVVRRFSDIAVRAILTPAVLATLRA